MRSGPDMRVEVHTGAPEDLPAGVASLFGRRLFESAAWYRSCCKAGLPAGARAVFVSVSDGAPVALFPMLSHGAACGSFTTPYTCLWQPMLAPGADARAVGRAFGRWCRAWPTVRLDALDLQAPPWAGLLHGLRDAGLLPMPFDHFGNWTTDTRGAGWDAYLAARPGPTREALRRRGRKLAAEGAVFRVVESQAELPAAIAAYEKVYAASWKEPEPFPQFNATLMHEAAAAGWLRLGLLEHAGDVVAAQIWVVQGIWGAVLKLAHDERRKAVSPGTVLTGFMIRHLLEQDGVTVLDFGRGDDAYKKAWTDSRAQRQGLILANPMRPAGLAAILRQRVRSLIRQPTAT